MRQERQRRRWVLGLITTGCMAAAAAAPRCGPHVVALYPYAPFLRETADRGWEGIDFDLLEELRRRSGCELNMVVESRVRTWEQMRGGTVDLTLSAVPTPERRSFAEFVPYAQSRYYLMLRPDIAPRVRSLADFEADASLRLLTVKSYAYGPTLDALLQRLRSQQRLEEVADFPAVLRMAKAGRAHALMSLPAGWPEIDATLAPGPRWPPLDVAPGDRIVGAMAISLSVPVADRQRLRNTLLAMRSDGSVQAILRRHVGEAAAREALYTEPAP